MKYVVGGIAIAAVSAGVAWFRMMRGYRRDEQAMYDQFHARFRLEIRSFRPLRGRLGGQRQRRRVAASTRAAARPEGAAGRDLAGRPRRRPRRDGGRHQQGRAALRYHPDVGGNEEHAKTLNAFNTALQDAMP